MTASAPVTVADDREPQSQASAVISVRDVSMRFPIPKRYREWLFSPFEPRRICTALTHASAEVQPGDRIAVMGPNGAGKTTLLRLIGGVIFPSEGEILVNGHDTVRQNGIARRSVGFVFNEERSFFWRLSGIQNLEFFGALDNLAGPDLRHRIHHALRRVGLEGAANQAVSGYSSGMKQRLALARVLILEPDVLILDEPTRALDPIACDEMIDLLLEEIHRSSRKTLLIATHRVEEAMTLCNKVMIIDGGRIRAFDSIENITATGMPLLRYYREALRSEVAQP
ncbi:MAG TPA: ABC transporter ATP-binding protein [Acidobacteriaceae bacterium]|nr:ABC transporter ATP-binding protein [Acidobacteriaceae bacterium]